MLCTYEISTENIGLNQTKRTKNLNGYLHREGRPMVMLINNITKHIYSSQLAFRLQSDHAKSCLELLVQDKEGTVSEYCHRLPPPTPVQLKWDYCWAHLLSCSFQLCQYRAVHFSLNASLKTASASYLFIIPALLI